MPPLKIYLGRQCEEEKCSLEGLKMKNRVVFPPEFQLQICCTNPPNWVPHSWKHAVAVLDDRWTNIRKGRRSLCISHCLRLTLVARTSTFVHNHEKCAVSSKRFVALPELTRAQLLWNLRLKVSRKGFAVGSKQSFIRMGRWNFPQTHRFLGRKWTHISRKLCGLQSRCLCVLFHSP